MADGIRTHAARQYHFSALFALFVLTCVSKPASQKTKIAQKLSAVGYKAVLPELIFVQARQSLQRILDVVFARGLTRHGLKPTCQNRHGFKSRQPTVKDRQRTYEILDLRFCTAYYIFLFDVGKHRSKRKKHTAVCFFLMRMFI